MSCPYNLRDYPLNSTPNISPAPFAENDYHLLKLKETTDHFKGIENAAAPNDVLDKFLKKMLNTYELKIPLSANENNQSLKKKIYDLNPSFLHRTGPLEYNVAFTRNNSATSCLLHEWRDKITHFITQDCPRKGPDGNFYSTLDAVRENDRDAEYIVNYLLYKVQKKIM
jgi:hypothetical protein